MKGLDVFQPRLISPPRNLMSKLPLSVVNADSYLTLHYRLATVDDIDIVTTFNDNPATLQIGQGQLAPFLEKCLMGLEEGVTRVFDLEPEAAFGLRNPSLLRRVSRATLNQNSNQDEQYKIGDLVDFAPPGGGQFAGTLLEIDEDSALFDFNHPLAGQPVQLTVLIIGIL